MQVKDNLSVGMSDSEEVVFRVQNGPVFRFTLNEWLSLLASVGASRDVEPEPAAAEPQAEAVDVTPEPAPQPAEPAPEPTRAAEPEPAETQKPADGVPTVSPLPL